MRSEYWREHWNKSAKESEDIRLISGWGNRTFQEILFVITDVEKKLALKSEDRLLDVGCGAGLFEIAYTHWLKEIYGVDYSEEMVEVAKKNTEKYDNIIIEQADIRNLPFEDEFFDKVLVNSVIQYLNNLNEIEKAFEELRRVTKAGGQILVSMNLDANKKEDYFAGYDRLGLSEEEIKRKINASNKALWFDRDELRNVGKKIGFKAKVLDMVKDIWQSKYFFDLLLIKEAVGNGKG
jgi:ubiquinone/menaquinone biosynthesis C-methylase UbiE